MRKRIPGDRKDGQAFPRRRPEIAVRELDGAPFAVECPELRWWLVVPRLGEEAMQATYKDIDVDRSHALVIDGQTRYHWTDRVTGAGLGL